MFRRKMLEDQLEVAGVRLGDCCLIQPFQGRKKTITINRHQIDFVSQQFRPGNLSMSYLELPRFGVEDFHYRMEMDNPQGCPRFVFKTLTGRPFWMNGMAAKEAFVERADRIFIGENRLNFTSSNLEELTASHFDHPVLRESKLMNSELQILIQGETGTGKSDLAQKVHLESRRPGNFIAVNLSSFNPQLIESELFGHSKGAFTGAVREKLGAFEAASGGTLFLDEVDSLPIDLQTKLLTFLDSKRFRRVGEVRETEIRARLIFATGRALEPLVEAATFRRDFYFRLKSGHTVELSPLRDDPARTREACRYFALKHELTLSDRLLEFYVSLAWPGNLRQLFGHLEKKKVLSRGRKLDFDHLDEELLLKSSNLMALPDLDDIVPMSKHKVVYAKKVFGTCEGNVALTARKLQLSERTVRSLIREN